MSKVLLTFASGEIGQSIRVKFQKLISKNSALSDLREISKILSNMNGNCNLSTNVISFYKFAPLQSCDVERSFSAYKSFLIEGRTSFNLENIE